jgi:tRNA pseudouridine55 synthase
LSRRKTGRNVHGIFLLDKPEGISSNRALQIVRRLYQARKGGHTGSLDPFATGMLPLCLGEASKTAGYMLNSGKTYRACARLGQATETGDTEGEVVEELAIPALEPETIENVFRQFTGTIDQIPPMYSALKHEGRRLYEIAREGGEVERPPRPVTIYRLELISWQSPELTFEVHCSKGTYVRTLAEDLARALGTCAHLKALCRTSIDAFSGQDLVTIEMLEQAVIDKTENSLLLPVDAGLSDWPVITVDEQEEERLVHGNSVFTDSPPIAQVRIKNGRGQILALGEADDNGLLNPRRLFLLGS